MTLCADRRGTRLRALLALILFALTVGALGPLASAQIARPASTPRGVAAARPTITARYPTPVPTATGNLPGISVATALWLESDSGVFTAIDGTGAAPADGARIGSWRDQSSNAHLLVKGASSGPFYQTNESPNGKAAVDFAAAGSTQLSKAGVTNLIASGVPFTMGFVLAGPSTGGTANGGAWIAQDEGGGDTDKWIVDNGTVSGGDFNVHINNTGVGQYNIEAAGTLIVGDPIETRVVRRKPDGTWLERKNGTEIGGGTTTLAFSASNTGDVTLGFAEGAFALTGEIFAIVIYSSALTDAEVLTLESYLAKY